MSNNQLRINHLIDNPTILLLDKNKKIIAELSLEEALGYITDNLDLIEISTQDGKSICILDNYSKYIYSQKKTKRLIKPKPTKTIRIRPVVDRTDLIRKADLAIQYIEKGHGVHFHIWCAKIRVKDRSAKVEAFLPLLHELIAERYNNKYNLKIASKDIIQLIKRP